MNADWDTVIILDACRYDFFDQRKRLQRGSLQRAVAPGSESREFITRQFQGKTLHDTVYTTGNPYASLLDDGTFHNIFFDEAWDTNEQTVDPARVTDIALDVHEEYPDKRHIVHYMQPHLPILAPEWSDINEKIVAFDNQYWLIDTNVSDLRSAYAANLEYVLQFVEQLLDGISGRVVVTSDHGELLGERQSPIPIRGTDHLPNLYVPELLDVPWLVIDQGPRRKIVSEPPEGDLDIDENVRDERLEALGYV